MGPIVKPVEIQIELVDPLRLPICPAAAGLKASDAVHAPPNFSEAIVLQSQLQLPPVAVSFPSLSFMDSYLWSSFAASLSLDLTVPFLSFRKDLKSLVNSGLLLGKQHTHFRGML